MVKEKTVSYSVDFGKWNSVFVVPAELIEKYMKNSNEYQIKVILYILCKPGIEISAKQISEDINIPEPEVVKSVNYWKDKGYIRQCVNENNQNVCTEKICTEDKKDMYETSVKSPVRYQRPDSFHVAARVQASSEINSLMQEAQIILGRPLSNGDSAILLMLHDNDGLPVDVILMILQYAVNVGKTGMKYIEKIGSSWAREGIDNLEKAEKKIMKLNKTQILWKRFEKIIGIEHRAPTKSEEEAVVRWFDEWKYSDELIKESYERCVNSNGKYILKYMDSIVKRWQSQGITTIEQALAENTKRKRKNSREDSKPSYDIDEYEKYNIFDYI